jgi:hypothetical protein
MQKISRSGYKCTKTLLDDKKYPDRVINVKKRYKVIKMSRLGHKGEKMLETVLWVVFLIMFGAIATIATFVAIFMLSEEK